MPIPPCYPLRVDSIAVPALSPNFAATVSVVSALALVLGTARPALRAMRKVEPRLLAARDSCIAVLGEARVVERAVVEGKAAIGAFDPKHDERIAELNRVRQALQDFQEAVDGTSRAMADAIRTVEGLRDIESTIAMVRRGWGMEWRKALDMMRSLASDFETMFKTKAIADAKRQADELYALGVAEDAEQALRVADELRGRIPADAESVIATLKSMVDFCEAHGIELGPAEIP